MRNVRGSVHVMDKVAAFGGVVVCAATWAVTGCASSGGPSELEVAADAPPPDVAGDTGANPSTGSSTGPSTGADTGVPAEAETVANCDEHGFAAARVDANVVMTGGRHLELVARTLDMPSDVLRIQWWPSGPGAEGALTFGPEIHNCGSASGCLVAERGCDAAGHCAKTFAARAGTFEVTAHGEAFSAALHAVRLEEVTRDAGGQAQVVPGGASWCIDGAALALKVCAAGWTSVARDGGAAACELQPEPAAASQATFDALTAGLPTPLGLPDRAEDTYGTVGTLTLGLHPHVVPIVTGPHGTLVAASVMGSGRVVAFAGQDFLSSGDRSTLLGQAGATRLLANAAGWVRGARPGRLLVDNEAVRVALAARGVSDVDVIATHGDTRDWSVDLSGYAAIVVQVNEWGTARIAPADMAHLRAFVAAGGGLVVAGSALHWSWWLTGNAAVFPGNTLLAGTGPGGSGLDGAGIAWNVDSFLDLAAATAHFDALSTPLGLWDAYVRGAPVAASGYLALPGLFASAHDAGFGLDAALTRLLAETPALPVASSSPPARLSATVIATLPPTRWPGPHPWAAVFPGAVPAEAPRLTDYRVAVDRRWVGPLPLGLYAPPGEVVTVRLPAGAESLGLVLQVGERHDELETIAEITTWERAPHMFRHFPARASEVQIGSALGGTIYVDLPESEVRTGTLEFVVSGAIRQPLFVGGPTPTVTSDWAVARTYPAPQALLELPGKVRLAVDASAIRSENDPAAILHYWEGFFDSHFTLSQEPSPRRRASHLLFDPQVGWGYANATTERIDFPKLSQVWALRRELDQEDIWLFGHELGHQFQTSNWSGGDITEVAVNLFTMYTLNGYRKGGGDRETRGFKDNVIDHAALKSLRWPTADLFEKLEMYRQLVFEFGWSKYQQVFASYYAPSFNETDDGTYLDGFAIRFSKVVQRDLTPFFDHWQYPLSAAARARIRGLGLAPWLPPGW